MVKTQWTCEDCGQIFNSRASRAYHRNHNCPGRIDGERQGVAEQVAREEQIAEAEHERPTEQPQTPTEVKEEIPIETEPEDYDRITIIEDEVPRPDDEEDDIPLFFIVIAAVAIFIITGMVIFREKIIAFFGGKKPKYGIPTYPEGA